MSAKPIEVTVFAALVAGALAAIVALFGFGGPSPALAQTDSTAPTVSSVAITSDTGDDEVYLDDDGVYGIGDDIQVTVTFSENVTVTGSPQLELTVGSRAKNAALKNTTDSKVVFSYTVAVGDSDTDGISMAADKLSLNGGSIKDAAENAADLSHSAVSAQSGHKVDGIRPTITQAPSFGGSTFSTDGVHTIGEIIIATVDFSEHVYVGGYSGPQMKLNFEGTNKTASFLGASPECVPEEGQSFALCVSGPRERYGKTLSFDYRIVKGDLDLDGVAVDANSLALNGGTIRDGAGNDAVLTHSAAAADPDFIVDAVPATVMSVAITSDPGSDNTYGVGDTIEVTVTFSESVRVPRWSCGKGICMPRLELNIGGAAKVAKTHERATIKGTAVVFRYTVQNGDNDADGIYIGANKLSLNGGSIEDDVGDSGGEDADITHSAVAESAEHKVRTPENPSKSDDATLSALTLSGINFGTFASGTTSYTASVGNSVSQATVSPTVNHSGASYVVKLGGVTDSDGVISLATGSNVLTVEVTAEDGDITKTYTVTVTRAAQPSTDATLSGLTLSGIDIGTFASGTTSYTAEVANSVTETTVTPTVNHSEASYVIKLGGVEDADGVVSLATGSNVITIEVTAEDDTTTRTYTVTITRLVSSPATEASSDATFSGLTLSGIDFGTFDSETLLYTAQVSNSVSQTTVAPTVNDSGASYVIKLGGVEDADGEISLAVGSNVITVEVTAEDEETTRTYTVTVTRAAPPSTDATLSALTMSGIDFGIFASGTTSYTAQVANSVSQTTVTPTVNHSEASYVIKLGGVEDADGEISLAVGSNVITVEVTAEDEETTRTYTVTVTRAAPPSTDATLSALTMSGIDFGIFASGTTSYTAQVANSVSQTTVTPTVNHSEASYVIKLGGVEDADGEISLAVGSNVITVEVTAEDEETTRTYTVTVTRAAPPSTDATLSALTLSGVDLGTFASGTTSYSAQVAYRVTRTTVTPTENDLEASHVIKLGGVTDADGVIALAVSSNVITIEVTAEDGNTAGTYTVTVTRAAPATDATLSALTMSGIDFGTFDSTTPSYTALVSNRVSQTTVTPTVNHSGASYVVKLGGVEDADGEISLAVGSNVITIEVTAEDGSTTRTYTGTVTRAAPPSTDATLSALTLSGVDFGTFDSTTVSYTATVPNSVSQTTVTPSVNESGASHVIKLSGVTDVDGVIMLGVGSNVIIVEVTAEDGSTTRTYTVTVTRAAPLSTDATLGALTLSGVDFGTFASGTTSYTAQVANSVSQTTVTPTVNHSGATYVIKLGGATDADGVVVLSVGGNVITVEVTAEDDSTAWTYTVTVTRAEPLAPEQLSSDATLAALTLSEVDFGTFDSTTVSYTAQVGNSVSQTTVTPTVNDSEVSYVIKLGGVTDSDSVIPLSVGSNIITVEVTAEDGETTRTYAVTVTRAAPPSTDAALSALTLNGIDFGTFDSTTASYTATVANSVSQTTVTPTVSDSGASYVIKLGGVTDSDGVISLAVGSNVVTVEVTAEDGNTTQTYTVTVTRAAPPSTDATLSALTLSGVDFGTFDSTTVSYTATVANSVSQTTVTPTVNHSGASYAIKLGGVEDDDGEIALRLGSNIITVEVTAEDVTVSRVYTVEVTRSELATPDTSEQRMADRYDTNNDDVIDKAETIAAIRDYFNGLITKAEAIAVITLYFSSGA